MFSAISRIIDWRRRIGGQLSKRRIEVFGYRACRYVGVVAADAISRRPEVDRYDDVMSFYQFSCPSFSRIAARRHTAAVDE